MLKNFLSKLIFLILILYTFSSILTYNNKDEHYTELARSIFYNNSYTVQNLYDSAFYKGNYYWPLGLLPAVTLIPFVASFDLFNISFYQGHLSLLFLILTYFLIYKIAIRLHFSKRDSLFWVIAFCFGSSFMGVSLVPNSWYFAHIVAVCMMFASIYEYTHKKRYGLIGIYIGLSFLTRATTVGIVLFYIIDIISEKTTDRKNKLSNLLRLGLPLALSLTLFFSYNFVRFENIFSQGYNQQILHNEFKSAVEKHGLFGFHYIPTNLYYMLINTPDPVFEDSRLPNFIDYPYIKNNKWGVSIFFVSLWLLQAIFIDYKRKRFLSGLIPIVLTIFVLSIFYGTGARQIGYRYSLDFLPLLFFIFIEAYKNAYPHISKRLKVLICLSVIINIYLEINN